MPQQDTRVRIHVRVRVGHLAVLLENARHDFVNGVDDLKELVVGHVLEGEFALAGVARVRLAQDGVAVAGNDLFGIERVPGEFRNRVLVDRLALGVEFGLEFLDPFEDFLVGESVEGTREGVETGRVREEGVAQCGTDQVSGVGTGVTSFVVAVVCV